MISGRGLQPRGSSSKAKEWIPITKRSQLVKNMTMKSLEEISLFYLPSKESEITYFFLVISLKGEVLNITSIQKKV